MIEGENVYFVTIAEDATKTYIQTLQNDWKISYTITYMKNRIYEPIIDYTKPITGYGYYKNKFFQW